MKLIPDSPAGNNQTFAVAGGIVHIVLHSDERDFARTLAAAIQRAFNWPEVYCQFNGRAKHLSDRHKLSEDWRAAGGTCRTRRPGGMAAVRRPMTANPYNCAARCSPGMK